MWVTNCLASDAKLPELAPVAVTGGVDLIQVREPGLAPIALELLVRAIQVTAGPAATVIVNSSIELARKLGCGVHLPERGDSIDRARAMLGPDAIVGRSVHSVDAAKASTGATFLVAGHVFETASKAGAPPIGLAGLRQIVEAAPAPVIAIGGIRPMDVRAIREAGAAGVAVMSPLTRISTIQSQAFAYRQALEENMSESKARTTRSTINGKETELPVGTTIGEFLASKDLPERLVVVERNGEIVKRDRYHLIEIEDGDTLEIVHFVGGGDGFELETARVEIDSIAISKRYPFGH